MKETDKVIEKIAKIINGKHKFITVSETYHPITLEDGTSHRVDILEIKYIKK